MILNLTTKKNIDKYDGFIIPLEASHTDVEVQGISVRKLIENNKLKAKGGSLCHITVGKDGLVDAVIAVFDDKYLSSYRKLLSLFGDAFKTLEKNKAKNIAVDFEHISAYEDETTVKAAAEAMLMAGYKFDDFKTKKDGSKSELKADLIVNENKFDGIVQEAKVLSAMNLKARELVNLPANLLTPSTLADKVEELGKQNGFETKINGIDEIKDLGMEAYMSVAKASDEEPKLIVMRYNGNSESNERLGLVGKGLTYDSGGLSIKSTKGMVDMKGDMAGSAAVIGAISAVAAMKLKVNVTAVVAACENMISGRSYRPGDIIGSMGGKSVFVGNTDAEGRLTLIDAMHYIVTREKVTRVLDIATLTGAALKCGGNAASIAISNDDGFYAKAEDSFMLSGEQVIRMPILDEFRELIKHEHADLTNIAGDPGTITAGLFVGAFNGDKPWIHVDIAGTFMSEKDKGIYSKGATGEGVRPLYYLAKSLV